jgi:hypothetical protein
MFLFHEEMWSPPAEGAQLVYPILRNSSEVILGGAAENVMGPRWDGSVDEGEAMVGRGREREDGACAGYGTAGGSANHPNNVSGTATLLTPGLGAPSLAVSSSTSMPTAATSSGSIEDSIALNRMVIKLLNRYCLVYRVLVLSLFILSSP